MTVEISETRDIAACHAVRRAVFVVEQGIALADELDGRDEEATHLLATDKGIPVGTARLLEQGATGKIGRVAVLPSHRGQGLGRALVEAAVAVLASRPHLTQAKLGAQTHAIGFYESLGFTAVGDIYEDAGVPHRDMVRAL